jgi:nucleoid DNA-binding protein
VTDLTREQLARDLAHEHGLSILLAEQVVGSLFERIEHAARKGRRVTLRGFGSFAPRRRPPRTFRHPETGEPVKKPSRTTLHFRPSRTLIERLSR